MRMCRRLEVVGACIAVLARSMMRPLHACGGKIKHR